MEVVEAGCCFERARKPRVLVRRWRGWGSSIDSPADRTQSVRMCRAWWVDECAWKGALSAWGEEGRGEEKLERIKAL